MQSGDFVKISFEGRIKGTGQVFDSGEIGIVVGAGYVIKGLDEALLKMSPGQKAEIEIPPEKAFGKRQPSNIKLISRSEFRAHGTVPKPGMFIEADGKRGKILSVSGGRVTVDFNHPLAGKTLIYKVEIKELVQDELEKAKCIVNYFTKLDKIKCCKKDNVLEIELPPVVNPIFKKRIAQEIKKHTKFGLIKFIETF